MKISKILAGMSAAALAASMMSLAAFADETATVKADLTGGTVSLIDEKDDDGVVTKTGVLTGTNVKLSDVCGIDVNVTVGADSAAKIEAGDWIGGGLGYNSESTGWASKEWSFQEGAKDVTGVKADDGSYDFVLKGTDPVFADTDTFAQVWLQNWTTEDFTFNAFTLLDKDGNPLTLLDIMSVDDNIIENLDLKLNSKKLGQFIKEELNEREQKIIVLRYGLDGKEAMTQKSVAKMLGISRSYVSRIETKALKQLRKRFETSSNL